MQTLGGKERLLTTKQVAARLGVCPDTVRRAVRDGSLDPVRVREHSCLKFRASDIERLVAGRRDEP